MCRRSGRPCLDNNAPGTVFDRALRVTR
jgi:hypothetical protein